MDNVIQFTLAQLLAYAGAIITISTAIGVIINLVLKLREPEKKQNERIKGCEERLDKIEQALEKDLKRFEGIDEGNKIILQGLQALMKHALNGNDNKQLEEAERELEKYLINK